MIWYNVVNGICLVMVGYSVVWYLSMLYSVVQNKKYCQIEEVITMT